MARATKKPPITCRPRMLPRHQWVSAAEKAMRINPVNRPRIEMLSLAQRGFIPTKEHLAVVTTKYWHTNGVRLTVGFLDSPPADLRARIVLHMNAWSQTANVQFTETTNSSDAQVRIARVEGGNDGGYWSLLGTDILSASSDEPTLNLEGFTMDTPESEFHRVVRHETGHTLGFPHEHMRAELVAKIVPEKAYDYFLRTQGWDQHTVDQQVLTPIEESSLLGTEHADPNSIMCYQIPGEITVDGQPIVGGVDIDDVDYSFAALIYPSPSEAPKPTISKPGQASPLGWEDFIEAASRASLRAIQPQPLPPGSAATTPRPRIFIGIVASEQ